MADLTADQRHILTVLSEYVHPPSVRQLTDNLERPGYRRAHWSIDQVASSLRRMEKRGLVQHHDGRRAHRWSLTDAGRAAIAEAGDA